MQSSERHFSAAAAAHMVPEACALNAEKGEGGRRLGRRLWVTLTHSPLKTRTVSCDLARAIVFVRAYTIQDLTHASLLTSEKQRKRRANRVITEAIKQKTFCAVAFTFDILWNF